ncbi:MAG: acyl-CoA dehydrogenase family protein [Acidimicrobiales bacterium]
MTIEGSPTVDAARRVAPTLAAHRQDADRAARMAPAVCDAMGRAGMFALCAPRECGGAEVGLVELVETIEVLARADPGAAWHVGNSVVAGCCAASSGPADRAELFADLTRPFGFSAVPGGTARPVDGGWSITGRWPFVTGSLDAGWLGLTARVHEADGSPRLLDGRPVVRTFYVRAADVQVEPTWEAVAGMRSSGSNAVAADAVRSPGELSYSFFDPRPLLPRPLYQIVPYQLFWATVVGTVLGIWAAAVDAAAATVSGKRSSIDGGLAAELVSVQHTLAEADTTRRAFRLAVLDGLGGVWEAASARGGTTATERAPAWAAMILAPDRARESVSRLYAAATTQVWLASHPLARAVADLHAITVAFERFRPIVADHGRQLAGLEPLHPLA